MSQRSTIRIAEMATSPQAARKLGLDADTELVGRESDRYGSTSRGIARGFRTATNHTIGDEVQQNDHRRA
jgi:hypothetical protein